MPCACASTAWLALSCSERRRCCMPRDGCCASGERGRAPDAALMLVAVACTGAMSPFASAARDAARRHVLARQHGCACPAAPAACGSCASARANGRPPLCISPLRGWFQRSLYGCPARNEAAKRRGVLSLHDACRSKRVELRISACHTRACEKANFALLCCVTRRLSMCGSSLAFGDTEACVRPIETESSTPQHTSLLNAGEASMISYQTPLISKEPLGMD